ncbi:hypothetical protein HYE69_01815 [Staphylococcus sp. GSSP0090]|nr:hypothetical protein [Staphylococcus sp. GSSP0090]
MKKLIIVCLGVIFLLAACGNKVDGTYKNNDLSITANSESGNATLHINAMETDGIFGMGENSGDIDGKVDKDKKVMKFNGDGEDIQINYKVKGDKLIIDNPIGYGNNDKKIELTKA